MHRRLDLEMRKISSALLGAALCFAVLLWAPENMASSVGTGWVTQQAGNVFEVYYDDGNNTLQYATLHTDSGYLRINYGAGSAWGTSVILPPSFWSQGAYYQGTALTIAQAVVGETLVITGTGTLGGLDFNTRVTMYPPTGAYLYAHVTGTSQGNPPLDNRPGEAFKPVMLSSMHVSATQWDAQGAYADCTEVDIPSSGWVFSPPASGQVLGLRGGTSAWQTNTPTIEIHMSTPYTITGWVTFDTNPAHDNIGLWAASDAVLAHWEYDITSSPLPTLACLVNRQYLPMILR